MINCGRLLISRVPWLALALAIVPHPASAAPETASSNEAISRSAAGEALSISSFDSFAIAATYYRAATTPGPAPVLIAVHGGGWRLGTAKFYSEWGPFLAARGYSVLAIDYRLSRADSPGWPGAAQDVLAAISYVRKNASALGIDPSRIGLMGDSAGAHLSALAALDAKGLLDMAAQTAGAKVPSTDEAAYRVRAVVGLYGVYDLVAQWETDTRTRPLPLPISQAFMGNSMLDDRMRYIAASPISHLGKRGRDVSFLIAYGDQDEVVDPETQSKRFAAAARLSGNYVRSIVLPGAGHYWLTESPTADHSWSAEAAPRILAFLADRL